MEHAVAGPDVGVQQVFLAMLQQCAARAMHDGLGLPVVPAEYSTHSGALKAKRCSGGAREGSSRSSSRHWRVSKGAPSGVLSASTSTSERSAGMPRRICASFCEQSKYLPP